MSLKQDLPKHIKPANVAALVDEIAEQLLNAPSIRNALEACELQPTTRCAGLAAHAAVMVLLAHELGQEVAWDSANYQEQIVPAGETAFIFDTNELKGQQ